MIDKTRHQDALKRVLWFEFVQSVPDLPAFRI